MYNFFMKTLFLLPFRGLLWLVLGILCSSFWLLLLALFTITYWLPPTLSYFWEAKTHFPCKIHSVDIEWLNGKISLQDVTLYNPSSFSSTDAAHFSKIECRFDWLSLPKDTLHIYELNFDGTKLASITQQEKTNWRMLQQAFHLPEPNPSKGIWIESLRFALDGIVACHRYQGTPSVSAFRQKRFFHLSNVCIQVPTATQKNLQRPCRLSQVYHECETFFQNH